MRLIWIEFLHVGGRNPLASSFLKSTSYCGWLYTGECVALLDCYMRQGHGQRPDRDSGIEIAGAGP